MATIAAVAAAGFQLAGGIQANREARRQAKIASSEAEEKARFSERQTKRFRSKQLVNFLKSGVTLEGTPTDVLTDTERLGALEAASIRGAGAARAKTLKAQGRQALFQGIGGGIGSSAKFIGNS